MAGSDRTTRRNGTDPAEELEWAADRLRTEVVGSLVDEGERLWRRLAEAHEGAENRVEKHLTEVEQNVTARLDARFEGEAAKLAEYARELEELSQRRLEAHAAALTESVAERAGEVLAGEVARIRSETSQQLAAHAREVVELARVARAAEAEREERLARGLAMIDERGTAALAERFATLEEFARELAEEIEGRLRPRPLDIPRPGSNGHTRLERP